MDPRKSRFLRNRLLRKGALYCAEPTPPLITLPPAQTRAKTPFFSTGGAKKWHFSSREPIFLTKPVSGVGPKKVLLTRLFAKKNTRFCRFWEIFCVFCLTSRGDLVSRIYFHTFAAAGRFWPFFFNVFFHFLRFWAVFCLVKQSAIENRARIWLSLKHR